MGASATIGRMGLPENDGPLMQKVLVLVTEDWFALSHFRPLIRRLKRLAREVVVVARPSDTANATSMCPLKSAAGVNIQAPST